MGAKETIMVVCTTKPDKTILIILPPDRRHGGRRRLPGRPRPAGGAIGLFLREDRRRSGHRRTRHHRSAR